MASALARYFLLFRKRKKLLKVIGKIPDQILIFTARKTKFSVLIRHAYPCPLYIDSVEA